MRGSDDAERAFRRGVEVEGKLLGQRLDQRPAVAEGQPRAMPDRAGLDERIAHAGGLAHGLDRLADALGGDARGAQRAQGAQLGEIFKGIVFVGGNQPRLLPRRQLAGSQMQNSQNVLTAISGHVWVSTGTVQCSCGTSDASMRREGARGKGVHRLFIRNSWISRTKSGSGPIWQRYC